MGGLHQLDLLAWNPRGPFIAGPDVKRLAPQMQRVFDCLKDGRWWTLEELHKATGDPTPSISARFRDLGNQFGFNTEHQKLGKGLWRYRMVVE